MIFILALVSGCSENNCSPDTNIVDSLMIVDEVYNNTVKVPAKESLIYKKYLRIKFLKMK